MAISQAAAGFGLPGVVSEGDEWPVHQNTLVQANAGYGSEQYNPASYPMAPFGASPDGLGAYSRMVPQQGAIEGGVLGSLFGGSPLVRGIKLMRPTQRRRSMRGYGADDPVTTPASPSATPAPPIAMPAAPPSVTPASVLAVSMSLLLTGIAGYYVGKAVAPSRDAESKYAWWGVVAGLLGGPLGLGVEAVVALNHKGG